MSPRDGKALYVTGFSSAYDYILLRVGLDGTAQVLLRRDNQ